MQDVPDIFRAEFDNADAAYALGLHNFPDYRKSLERIGAIHLPRIDVNPARPKFRIGHIYEYALLVEVSRVMRRETAGDLVGRYLDHMNERAGFRLNDLSEEDQEAIRNDGMMGRYLEESAIETSAAFHWFVDYPWLAFDPDVLDRSEERQTNPVLWVIAGDPAVALPGNTVVTESEFGVPKVSEGLTKAVRLAMHLSGERVGEAPSVNTMIVVNVTAVLTEVDRRLNMRLRARRLRGAE